ncbi:MAG: Uma2 family endonuclease [Actinomycetota bacterium]|nr:Uma2 family endonuclease [Actinomycetota bacterium]
MAETRTQMTAQELLGLPDDGKRYELVKGELREMVPAGARHGSVAARLTSLLDQHVRAEGLGIVLAAETGFRIFRDPDTVRAPDVSFVARERVPAAGPPEGYWNLAPDLVVEVVSPNDTASEVQSKVQMWLESGVRLAWVVYPSTRSVVVYESLKEISTLTTGDVLSGGNVVPGFGCAVEEIFE